MSNPDADNKAVFTERVHRGDRTNCRLCGARRIDSQLGLEATPEEYVAEMVGIFREVRRVLRGDGTLWLNLGDSYAGSGKGGNPEGSQWSGFVGNDDRERSAKASPPIIPNGLKAKDLCGIPWAIAKALQTPYYTGKIKRVEDRIWLAAMIDGEGCIFIHKRKVGQNNGQGYFRQNDSYSPGLEVSNTHRSIVERCLEITGIGSICTVERESRLKNRNIPLHRWNVRSNQSRNIIREVYPYLVGKQHEARLLLGCPSSGKEAEEAHAGLMSLHNGYIPQIDFPAPSSMFEQGWYLRSEIIWSKKNPMPESVTDRPTKSHEQIFLLSKQPRYFYDAEAIKETGVGRLDRSPGSRGRIGEQGWTGSTLEESNGRNKRSVWTIAISPYSDAHFATFPPKLIEPCILAGTSARGCCAECGAPWERVVETARTFERGSGRSGNEISGKQPPVQGAGYGDIRLGPTITSTTTGWRPICEHDTDTVPATVLDPFAGSGTVGKVALELGRKAILIELNPKYCELIDKRVEVTLGLPGLA